MVFDFASVLVVVAFRRFVFVALKLHGLSLIVTSVGFVFAASMSSNLVYWKEKSSQYFNKLLFLPYMIMRNCSNERQRISSVYELRITQFFYLLDFERHSKHKRL